MIFSELRCAFCSRSQPETRKMIAGPSVYVCTECIALCTEILREEGALKSQLLEERASEAPEERPEGKFPTRDELQGKKRDEIEALLRERGFAAWKPFHDLVDAAERARDEIPSVPPTLPRTMAGLAGKSREEIVELLRATGSDEKNLERMAEQLHRAVGIASGRIDAREEARRAVAPRAPLDPSQLSKLSCSFCGKNQIAVSKLIAGPAVYICNECIELANDIIAEEGRQP